VLPARLESGSCTRSELYLTQIPGIRAVIVVCVRYPWDYVEDRSQFDVEDGNMIFLYYSRNGVRDARDQIVPDFVSSFGRVALSHEEQLRVVEITGIDLGEIRGAKEDNQLQCNPNTREHPEFNFEVPGHVLFLQNNDDAFTITNQLLADVQLHHLRFNLYDLQDEINEIIPSMNLNVVAGTTAVIPRARPAYF